MSLYYTIYTQNTNQKNLEQVAEILCAEVISFEEFVKIRGINVNRFYELEQLLPFEEAKDPCYFPERDYAFAKEDQKALILFFKDSKFILCYDDCTDNALMYFKSKNSPLHFSTCDLRFWEDASEYRRQRILQAFNEANVHFDAFKAIF